MPSAPITECYEPYEPQHVDNFPGICGVVAHDEDCECDLDRAFGPDFQATPWNADDVRHLAHESGYGKIANQARGGAPGRAGEYAAWASELLGAFEAVRGAAPLDGLVDAYRARRAGQGRWATAAPIQALLGAGLALRTIAVLLMVPVVDVVRPLTQSDDVDTEAYLRVDDLLHGRSEVDSYMAIARETGISEHLVRNLAQFKQVTSRLSISDAPSRRAAFQAIRATGGGTTVTDEQLAQIQQMRAAGVSYGKIGTALGLKKNTVVQTCLRRGWKPEAVA